ncbi:hypothetical protein KA082_02805 [Candidatus Woesebacteria bacterium]|nr:hypothetical protein [Candidatus Woesebacteria bacterium]
MPKLFDLTLERSLEKDKVALEHTQLPIITVSASFPEDAKRLQGLPNNNSSPDTVFSRAHYSMAVGVAVAAWGKKIDPAQAWLVDPTNYVSYKDWFSVLLTEKIGKEIARHPLLKIFKDFIDTFGRSKMPILESITPPLIYLTEKIEKPILSFHIAAGNILLMQGKKVFQMITDPHVREEYILFSDNPRVNYGVFDEATKLEFLEKAALHGKKADPERIIVTGPPVDPRIVKAREKKYAWRSGPLKLCITTGGLGTNKEEIRRLLEQLLPALRSRKEQYQILIYASTHHDIAQMVKELARESHVALGDLEDSSAKLRLLYHPQIIDANELLIRYGFPWADGFITKPSGDMAYDAVASGCFLLTLAEWGEWETNIRKIFEQKGISRKAVVEDILGQLNVLASTNGRTHSWVEQAMNNAAKIEKLYLRGSETIINAYEKFTSAS